jgi:hypothetical protein
MKTLREKRKHYRLNMAIALEFQVELTNSQESWSSRAMLGNISLGGLYFICESLPFLRQGDIGEFTWNIVGDKVIPSFIRTRGQVKRIEHHVRGLTDYGVAVEFLSSPATS